MADTETEIALLRERSHAHANDLQSVRGKIEGHERLCTERWNTLISRQDRESRDTDDWRKSQRENSKLLHDRISKVNSHLLALAGASIMILLAMVGYLVDKVLK